MDKIKKRNGTYADFDPAKIQTAIMKANVRVAEEPMTEEDLSFLTQRVVKKLEKENEIPDVEHIQDIVERTLNKAGYSRTAKAYILYRAEHAKMREMRDTLPDIFSNLTFKAANEVDMKRENANINTDTAMGTMLKFGTESAKEYFDKFILPPHIAKADRDGDIHIHDKDFYTITETCCQIDLLKLFKNGFSTGHGYLREPNSIRSYAALACIAIQSNQNEMHGGQAVPNFDYAMAEGIRKTYRKSFLKHLADTLENKNVWPVGTGYQELKKMDLPVPTLGQADEQKWPDDFHNKIHEALDTYGILFDEDYSPIARRAYIDTVDETHQAMEAVIHNLNSMHCIMGTETIWAQYIDKKGKPVLTKMSIFDLYKIVNDTEHHTWPKVCSLNPKTGAIEMKHVYAARRMDNYRDMVTLISKSGHTVRCTTNHKIMQIIDGKITEVLPAIATHLVINKTNAPIDGLDLSKTDETQYEHIATSEIVERKYWNTQEDYVYDISIVDNENFMLSDGTFIHNSRAGAQVPFSSINYGTDTSPEGQLAIKEILNATEEGLGNGETPIFPVQIFKVKEGVNYNPGDPNYELFKRAMQVSAKRLFPNFSFMDAPFNKQYLGKHPDKPWYDEVGYMGCALCTEVVTYKVGDLLKVHGIGRAWDEFVKTHSVQKYGTSEFINLENDDVTIWDSHTNGFVKVKKWIKNPTRNNWYQLKLSSGRKLIATSDHPLPTKNHGRTLIKNLTLSDQIPITNKQYSPNTKITPCFDTDFAWLLGILLCDSSYAQNIMISIGNDERDIERHIITVIKNLPNYRFSTYTIQQNRGRKGSYRDINIKCGLKLKPFKEWLTAFFGGRRKLDRQIPDDVFSWPDDYKAAFIAGMMDADGYINTYGVSQLGSTNHELATQQILLLQSIGIPAKCYINHYSKDKNTTRLAINFTITDEIIEHMHSQKKIQADNKCRAKPQNIEEFASIISLETLDIDEPSYDVETESDRFDISGILSHNCRTRVMANVYDTENEITPGRGNLSFTSINLPRIAIQSRNMVNEKGEFNSPTNMEKFYRILDERIDLCIEQLLHRFKIQCSKHAYNYPFLMGEGVWINSEKLNSTDTLENVLKHGTLSVGFIGLAETLVVLTGKHHGESEESWKLGYEIIKYIRTRMDQACDKYKLNFSCLATPAEGLCLSGDTRVHTTNGLKPIKDIKPGNTLITFNEKTNKFEPDTVVKSGMTGKRTDILQITFDDNTVVTCTSNHPFAVIRNNEILWVHAVNLMPDSKVKSKNGIRRVTESKTLETEIEVYDVTMAHNHNFLVGENEGILVHNSGTFIRIDKKKYGIIPGVTDREYYTNSFHVPVYYNISAFDKIKKEAPFHELTNAGHISYVEVDGDIAKNLDAFEAIIRCMKESGIGYGSVNHPVDRDPICGYVGIINDVCPRCGRHENEAVSLEKLEELKKKYRNMPDITKYIE